MRPARAEAMTIRPRASPRSRPILLDGGRTAAFKPEMMHAAHELNGPTFAHAILTTDELIPALSRE